MADADLSESEFGELIVAADGDLRDQLAAKQFRATLANAARLYPKEVRAALTSVFDLAPVIQEFDRMKVMAWEAVQEFDGLHERLVFVVKYLESLERRADEALRLVEELEARREVAEAPAAPGPGANGVAAAGAAVVRQSLFGDGGRDDDQGTRAIGPGELLEPGEG